MCGVQRVRVSLTGRMRVGSARGFAGRVRARSAPWISPCPDRVPVFPVPSAAFEDGVGVSGCGLGMVKPSASLAKRFH